MGDIRISQPWRARMAILAAAILMPLLSLPAHACGPSALTTAEVLEFQIGVIERGLKRETLTEAQRAEIAKLRADVEAYHKAEKRQEARAAMVKIVAMFSQKDMMGAVEPIVPGCAPSRPPAVTGMLMSIESEPNVPGARCGNHYVLTVKENGANGRVLKLTLYDLAKAPYATLKGMLNKTVEADTVGTSIVGIRVAGRKPGDVAGLAGLSPRKPC